MPPEPPVGQELLIIEASRSHWHTTLRSSPLDEGWARRKELYLTTHNTHKRKTAIHLAGFEPAIPASEKRQMDGAAI